MIKLAIREGETTRELELPLEKIVLGRSSSNPVDLADPKASREHCSIAKSGDEYLLENHSKNGMLLNGRRVEKVAVQQGDILTIGDTKITILFLDTPMPAPPPPPPAPASPPEPLPPAIDRRELALEEVRAAKRVREAVHLGVALVLITLALFFGKGVISRIQEEKTSRAPAPAPTPAPARSPLRDAEAELERFRARAESAPRVTQELIDEATALAQRHNAAYGSSALATPLDAMLGRLVQRRAEEEARRADEARARVADALLERKYAAALEAVKGAPEADLPALAQRVQEAIRDDFKSVDGFGKNLESLKLYADASEHYRKQAPRFEGTEHHRYLANKPEILEQLARAEADARVKPPDAPAPVPVEPPKPAVSPLFAKLIAAINAGKIPGSNFATEAEITRSEGKVPWSGVSADEMLKLYGGAGLKDEDQPALADWAWKAGLRAEAAKILGRHLTGDRAKRQAEVDLLVASWRLASVPKGGYSYDPKYGFEDSVDRLNRDAATKVPALAKTLSSTTDPKAMDRVFREILAYHDNPDLRPALKESIRGETVTALRANKEKRLKAIEAKAKASAGLGRLRELKAELNKRREAAIKLIYDAKIYLPENHPDWRKGDEINGQTAVDKLVVKEHKGSVGELWESAGAVVVQLDPSIRKDVDLVTELNTRYLADLGEKPSENDLKAFDDVILNLNARLDLRNFALDERERQLHVWNRAVDKYNEALADPGVTAEEKAHAKVVNDYREMMGRPRLFIDARLCRATKKHSEAQNAAQRIWHVGSNGDPQSRARAEGFPAGVGENVAIGYAHPEDVWKRGWYRASDHHRNGLMDAWNCMGYGYVGNVGSQNFSTLPPPAGLPPFPGR